MREAIKLAFITRMEAEGSDSGEIMLYGDIVGDYSKWYKEQYPEDKSASDLDKAVKELKKNGVKNLLLRINSPGGVVYQAIAMRSILSNAGFDSMVIRIEGMAASAATLIATIPGAEVEIAKGAMYMIHNPWTIAMGNANEMEKEIENLRTIEKTSRDMYAAKSGQSDEWLKEKMDAESWFTAEQAVEYGFCDRLARDGIAQEAAAMVTHEQMAVMKALYKGVPENVREEEEVPETKEALAQTAAAVLEGSNANPVAGSAPVNTHEEETHTMEIKDLTVDQLREENPALLESIRQEALRDDQDRRNEIDALTMIGYEEMAENAKNTGMSSADFIKAVAKAQKEKGQKHIENRQMETAPAKEIAGDAPRADADNEAEELKKLQAEMKAYAENAENGNSMY